MMKSSANGPYYKLLTMAIVSFAMMYLLMYSMVNTVDNIFPNVNQLYMSGLMTAVMLLIELLSMNEMYQHKKLNGSIWVGCSILALLCFLFIRQQRAVSDVQFLKSMIPHHASAILMSQHASIQDAEIKDLSKKIIASQSQEIEQMKIKLHQLEEK